jgi:AbrB family looped-hinge helix DNA binding protein
MRVTSKGQVTIPKPIRRRHRIHAGTDVEFVERGRELLVRTGKSRGGADRSEDEFAAYLDRVTGIVDIGVSTNDFMELLRGE